MEAWDVYKNGVFQYTEYSIYVDKAAVELAEYLINGGRL